MLFGCSLCWWFPLWAIGFVKFNKSADNTEKRSYGNCFIQFSVSFDWKIFAPILCACVCFTTNRVVSGRDPSPPIVMRDRGFRDIQTVWLFSNTMATSLESSFFYFMSICNHWMLSVPFLKLIRFSNILKRGRWGHSKGCLFNYSHFFLNVLLSVSITVCIFISLKLKANLGEMIKAYRICNVTN